jgi:hypothetical protein
MTSCITAARVAATPAILSSRRRATPSSSRARASHLTPRATTTTSAARRDAYDRTHDNNPGDEAALNATGRRLSLAGISVATLAAALPRAQRAAEAEVLTPRGYDDPTVNPSGMNTLVADAASGSIGCAYSIEWSSGWCALSDLSSARSVVGLYQYKLNPVDP